MAHRHIYRILERGVGRFDSNLVVDDILDSLSLQGLDHSILHRQFGDIGIGHKHGLLDAEIFEIHTDLCGNASAETDVRGGHFKADFMFHSIPPD